MRYLWWLLCLMVLWRPIHSLQAILKKNRLTKTFRDGNQLIFSKAIQSIEGSSGSWVHVVVNDDKDDRQIPIGYGVYNPNSLYRIRMLCHKYLQPDLYEKVHQEDISVEEAMRFVIHHHISAARSTRQMLNLPNKDTNTYRLVNGEGDSLSGLAIDVIDHVLVVMSSASWVQDAQPIITSVLQELFPSFDIVWKTTASRLEQDGYHTSDDFTVGTRRSEQQQQQEAHPDANRPVLSRENGIVYEVYPFAQGGQKTSVYCDQRENRAYIAQLCKGKRVLDLCCYHGGFSLNAAKAGALSVVGVDSSQDAIDACHRNAELNNLSHNNIQFIRDDIANFLKCCEDTTFDVVILDPPKLAPSVKSLDKAQRKYYSLNRAAMKVLNNNKNGNGGLLLSCTCSAAMTADVERFLTTVQTAAVESNAQLLKVAGAAPCHTTSPVSYPAGKYLTAALFRV